MGYDILSVLLEEVLLRLALAHVFGFPLHPKRRTVRLVLSTPFWLLLSCLQRSSLCQQPSLGSSILSARNHFHDLLVGGWLPLSFYIIVFNSMGLLSLDWQMACCVLK